MPIYDYTCVKGHHFSQIKTMGEYSIDAYAKCPECGYECGSKERDFSKSRPQFTGTKVQSAEFNPGLGCVVKNKYHREELCKEKNLVEVGNDFGNSQKMQDFYQKRKQEELDSNWKDPSDFFI